MTEEEAKTKWCPRAHQGEHQPCIASDCMAWRWEPLSTKEPGYIEAIKDCEKNRGMTAAKASAYVAANLTEFHLPTEPYSGYCGLAGDL